MNDVLLWLVLLVSAVTAVLVVVMLVRPSRVLEGVGKDVRD